MHLPWDARRVPRVGRGVRARCPRPAAWPTWLLENHDHRARGDVATRTGRRSGERRGAGRADARARAARHAVPVPGRGAGAPGRRDPAGAGRRRRRPRSRARADPVAAPVEVGPGAGFTTGDPWLPLVAGRRALCVEAQDGDPDSTLTFTRRLLALHRQRARAPARHAALRRRRARVFSLPARARRRAAARRAQLHLGARRDRPGGAQATVVLSTDPSRRAAIRDRGAHARPRRRRRRAVRPGRWGVRGRAGPLRVIVRESPGPGRFGDPGIRGPSDGPSIPSSLRRLSREIGMSHWTAVSSRMCSCPRPSGTTSRPAGRTPPVTFGPHWPAAGSRRRVLPSGTRVAQPLGEPGGSARVARRAPVAARRQRPAGPDLRRVRHRRALELARAEEALEEHPEPVLDLRERVLVAALLGDQVGPVPRRGRPGVRARNATLLGR